MNSHPPGSTSAPVGSTNALTPKPQAPKPWSVRRQRQYTLMKDRLIEQGREVALAEEIAARVVNKEWSHPHALRHE